MDKRSAQRRLHQHRQGIENRGRRTSAVDFFNLLTGPELLDITEAHLPEHRERTYPPTAVLGHWRDVCVEIARHESRPRT